MMMVNPELGGMLPTDSTLASLSFIHISVLRNTQPVGSNQADSVRALRRAAAIPIETLFMHYRRRAYNAFPIRIIADANAGSRVAELRTVVSTLASGWLATVVTGSAA
jgi:hypothetical protein